MPDQGWIKLWRGWRDNPVIFSGERALAWLWLLEHAAWRPTRVRVKGETIVLDRGQLSFAQRFLADQWGWSKSAVERFLADLRKEEMISTRSKLEAGGGQNSGQPAGHIAGQGQSIITICNYEKYQGVEEGPRGKRGARNRASPGQRRDEEEEGKKRRIREIASAISYSGSDPAAVPDPAESPFDEFWNAYPRRVGKEAARKAWASAIKRGVDPAHMIASARRYAALPHDDQRFIAHPSTWLNQGRYDDEDQPNAQEFQRDGRSARPARTRHPAAGLLNDFPGGFFGAEGEGISRP